MPMRFGFRKGRPLLDSPRFNAPIIREGKGVRTVGLNVLGLSESIGQLAIFSNKVIPVVSARTLAFIAVDLLANAQPRVPYDTGQLRESGEATIKLGRGPIGRIGQGKKDGSVEARYWMVRSISRRSLKGVRTVRAEVSYHRIGTEGADKGRDIALWTHEELWPYEPGTKKEKSKPRARKPGTGPKYLQLAWLEKQDIYVRYFKKELTSLEKYIPMMTTFKTIKKGKDTLQYTAFVHARIDNLGYYGGHKI